uniref:Uncharacterized protein n=1 Tax=Lepeophtheirus salmonis TaxID=72036 RepID=A0A0K2T2E4_LEPSM
MLCFFYLLIAKIVLAVTEYFGKMFRKVLISHIVEILELFIN